MDVNGPWVKADPVDQGATLPALWLATDPAPLIPGRTVNVWNQRVTIADLPRIGWGVVVPA